MGATRLYGYTAFVRQTVLGEMMRSISVVFLSLLIVGCGSSNSAMKEMNTRVAGALAEDVANSNNPQCFQKSFPFKLEPITPFDIQGEVKREHMMVENLQRAGAVKVEEIKQSTYQLVSLTPKGTELLIPVGKEYRFCVSTFQPVLDQISFTPPAVDASGMTVSHILAAVSSLPSPQLKKVVSSKEWEQAEKELTGRTQKIKIKAYLTDKGWKAELE